MNKGPSKARTQEARQRAQARREAIARAERRRRLGFAGMGGVLALVVVLVIVFVVVNASDQKKGGANVTAPASSAVLSDLSSIPASAYDAVGVSGIGTSVVGLSAISGGTPITTNGLPTFVYVGGEFCPYCAAERWAIVAALSRFGTFRGLDTTESSGTDVYPNTVTLSFIDATYTSKYIAFSGTEQEDRAEKLIKNPPAAEEAAFVKYGTVNGEQSYPFISIDNKYKGSVQYSPTDLKGMTAEQIAAAIKNPTSTVGKDVLASANVLTAGICAANGQLPSSVCSTPAVEAAGADLNETTGSTSGSSAG